MNEILKMILIRAGIFATLMLICTPFLIGYAFRCIEPVDFGISYNANSKQMDSENLYYSGRHYVGLGHSFKLFPRYQKALIFSDSDPDKVYDSIKCRSKEGLKLSLHIFLAYKLTTGVKDEEKIKQLVKTFNRFEYDYEKFIVLMTHSVIRNVAAGYNAVDFFELRSVIGDEMLSTLKEYFEEYNFELTQLYIINMEIPESFDAAILKTEIVNQQIEEKTYLKQAKMIEGNTSVLEAQYDAQIIVLKVVFLEQKLKLIKHYQKNKQQLILQNMLHKNSLKHQKAQKLIYKKIQFFQKDQLQLVDITDGSGNVISTVADQILQYIWIYQLKQMSNNVVLGLQQPFELNF